MCVPGCGYFIWFAHHSREVWFYVTLLPYLLGRCSEAFPLCQDYRVVKSVQVEDSSPSVGLLLRSGQPVPCLLETLSGQPWRCHCQCPTWCYYSTLLSVIVLSNLPAGGSQSDCTLTASLSPETFPFSCLSHTFPLVY